MPPLPPAAAIPGMTPFMPPPPMPVAASSTDAVQPVPANVVSAAPAGAAADPPAGADTPTTVAAEPMPAIAAPPTPDSALARVVPKPSPAPRGVASPIVKPNGAPATKCDSSGIADIPMNRNHEPVTLTVFTVSTTAPMPKNCWRAPIRVVGPAAAALAAGTAAELAVLCRPPNSPCRPALVPAPLAALLTAADCAADPPGFVFWIGSVNGVTCAAIAALAA